MITLTASAKLNLGLRVFSARPDSFHDIESWMLPISLYDTLTFEHADTLSLEITGRNIDIPTDIAKNLITRAATRLADAANIRAHARISLHKVIPPGGGLGGGSSDAAQTLVALNQLWNLNWPAQRLEKIAAELGSDIPFFIQKIPSLCTGRGEIMTPLAPAHPLFAILLISPIGCPTKDVYQTFDKLLPSKIKTQNSKIDWQHFAQSTASELNEQLSNDLQPAAFHIAPTLATLHQKAAEVAQQKIHLTGSGSTLFTLCSSPPAAAKLSDKLATALSDQCVCIPVKILAP